MDFALGYITAMLIMSIVLRLNKKENKEDLEKLKDFDTWKEWKNS